MRSYATLDVRIRVREKYPYRETHPYRDELTTEIAI